MEKMMHYVTNGSRPFLSRCKLTFSASYPHINSVIDAVLSRAGKYKNINEAGCHSLLEKMEKKYFYCFSRSDAIYRFNRVIFVSCGRVYSEQSILFYIRNKKYINELPDFIKSNLGKMIQESALRDLQKEYDSPDGEYCILGWTGKCDLCGKTLDYELKKSRSVNIFNYGSIYINSWKICKGKKCKKIATSVKKGNLIGNKALVKAIEKLTIGNKNARKENSTH